MGVFWQISVTLLGAAIARDYAGKGNCDVSPGSPADAGMEHYHSLTFGNEPQDLDDQLWGMEPETMGQYKELRKACKEPIDKRRCRTYGVSQWNLTSYYMNGMMGYGKVNGKGLCAEDQALYDEMQGVQPKARCNLHSPLCKMIDGQVRLTGFAGTLSRHNALILSKFPHLFSLMTHKVPEDLEGLHLPSSVRVVTLSSTPDAAQALPRLAPLLQKHGQIHAMNVHGQQSERRWDKVDLSLLCGLDLRRFSAYTIDAGDLPQCFRQMKNLEAFYCTNCMMNKLPRGLQGLTSLKSFVAFRQSEMIPCLAKDLNESIGPCKPAWETYAGIKEQPESTGMYEDFQEGPSWSCEQESYAFPFKDFMSLGWANVEKVWLDGNFLTGEIPEDIADVWPHLQSLDLYGNLMHGDVPHSLTKLDFVKLQLNGNDFSGELPKEIARRVATSGLMLGVASNPKLRGCVPSNLGTGSTQLTKCANDEL